ncbi:MAG TPA: winged helix-turn-helix domain-containing protein [Gemmatimonadaceae bacterium]|nr:winged helix-turn-helix domain-containing protein [Gemmatimonadaceae bacterium]
MVEPRALLRLDRQGGNSALPLHEQVYRQLRTRIESGALAGGTRLPAARTVAADLGVARNTVDAALLRLQQDGLVVRRAGAGSVVAEGVALASVAPVTRFAQLQRTHVLTLKVYAVAAPSLFPLDGLVDAALGAVRHATGEGSPTGVATDSLQRRGTLIVQASRDRNLAMLGLWEDDGSLEHSVWTAGADNLALFSRMTGPSLPLSPEALVVLAHEVRAWQRFCAGAGEVATVQEWESDVPGE